VERKLGRFSVIAAVILTAGAVGLNTLIMGRAVILLNIGLIASLLAWLAAGVGQTQPHRLVGPLFLASIAVQMLHLIEEYGGRFYELLPALFDQDPWQPQRFVVFNLVWIGIFLVAAVGVFKRVRLAYLAVWFMALVGGIGNAVLHTWLAIQSTGYAPGVATALINLPLGIALVYFLCQPQWQDPASRPGRATE
jgi:hypothetical protein